MQSASQQRAVTLASTIQPMLQGEDVNVVGATIAGLFGALVAFNTTLPMEDRQRILAAHAFTLGRMAEILSAERAAHDHERMAQ